MKTLLKSEEALQFALAAYLNTFLPFDWWWYWALFLLPDIGMIGYVFNHKAGALTYNLFHYKGIAIIIGVVGILLTNPYLQFTGLLLFGHSAFDRMLGYGMKYPDNFHNTHLGLIGRNN
jgi:hypothetical protein